MVDKGNEVLREPCDPRKLPHGITYGLRLLSIRFFDRVLVAFGACYGTASHHANEEWPKPDWKKPPLSKL